LTKNGYKMIGMDHFAKPEDELFKAIEKGELHRNFQGYTTKGGADLIGVGLTSIGEGVDYYAQNFKEYFADALEGLKPFVDDGLITISDEKIECSETGTLLIRNIAMPFDAYMKKHASSDKTFSKTV